MKEINCNGAWFDRLTVKRACADGLLLQHNSL